MRVTENPGTDLARTLEQAESDAFVGMFTGLPADYSSQYRFGMQKVGNTTVLSCKNIPFREFSRSVGLFEPATAAQVAAVVDYFQQEGIRHFYIHHIPRCHPVEMTDTLAGHGLRRLSSWDRIWRGAQPVEAGELAPEEGSIELIGDHNREEWASFIDKAYGMVTRPWLMRLSFASNFVACVLRRNGSIVHTRTMILLDDKAWMGIEAPVPGIMAPAFQEDYLLSRFLVQLGLDRGARLFVADIEKQSDEQATPAYGYWERLGFEIAYRRDNYGF